MAKCEHKHKKKHYRFGITYKVQCFKESKFIDEHGRELCTKHFKKMV